ncbi:type III secretion system outer membrane ring subunit SctC [Desulfatiglans anilini]|uniref:type III secretion system outer membrane ring subunit SctC n=1 Tax=Desulfatiglans anilini TaxID=90728 RepID=UPI00040F3313|nr:type III secretion system outer membrane ring subunit SctC [Desulfatiglans anilini]
MFSRIIQTTVLSCITFAILFTVESQAGGLPWRKYLYSHVSEGEDLADLLRDFCSSQHLSAVVSEQVKGTVKGRFIQMEPEVFLEHICRAYSLLWYCEGGQTLYFNRSGEWGSKIIIMKNLSFQMLEETLERMGALDERFRLEMLNEDGTLYVSGPPRYVELVSDVASKLNDTRATEVAAKAAREVIKIFPLKHAWAADLTFTFMDTQLTVLGVATILRQLFADYGTGGQMAEARLKILPRTIGKLKGKGLASSGAPLQEEQPAQSAEEGPPADRESDAPGERGTGRYGSAFIMADTRLNAVIVRDTEERLRFYEEMIPQLDIPVGLVQIQATIMDISTDYLHELGVNWRFHHRGSSNEGTRFTDAGVDVDEDFKPGNPDLIVGPGFNFATVIGSAANYILAKVHALEQDGKARVLSQPSVLTLDNVAALLEHSQTFYVRIPGDQEVDLFSVTAGIVLKVTPHIIRDGSETRIKLAVSIEDGNISPDQQVDQIPIVQKSSVNTQAVIKEDQSLLIGGYYHESHFATASGIPCLLNVPILNIFFKQDQRVSKRAERMFLITPRIILDEAFTGADPKNDLTALQGGGSMSRATFHRPEKGGIFGVEP